MAVGIYSRILSSFVQIRAQSKYCPSLLRRPRPDLPTMKKIMESGLGCASVL